MPAVLALALAGCSSGATSDSGKLHVEAAFYPLAWLAERIGGDAVTVENLTPPGAEPHDLELRASQVRALREADLTVYLKGFQAAVDEAVDGDHALDLSTAGDGRDPHVWLDPVRMVAMAEAVTARLADLAPASEKEAIGDRGEKLATALRALDVELRHRLASCRSTDVVTSHDAFGYLSRRYGLRQVGIAGLSPEEEPTARRLAEVAALVKERKVTTIFFETLVSPKLAETIARETGARTAVLDPIEGLEAGSREDYLSVMRANAAALSAALDCR